ncbi:SDR family oxidoreductase [Jatrophihabitans sp. YIM 134969]
MDISNRTVFLAGGTSGIGRELARQWRAAGSTVVVGGRRAVDDPDSVVVDVTDPAGVVAARDAVLAAHPDLDTLVAMSGVMLPEDLRDPAHAADAQTTVEVNLLGTIRLIDAFTPHLLARGRGTVVTVTSGIAFLPFPLLATYAATKAGVHAYSEALRAQLAGTGVEVAELVPPAVATTPEVAAANPRALPLDEFVSEALRLLAADPTPHEVLVDAVRMHRWAERDGTYDDLVTARSQALATLPGRAQA